MVARYDLQQDVRSFPVPFEIPSTDSYQALMAAATVSTLVIPTDAIWCTVSATVFTLMKMDSDPAIPTLSTFVEDDSWLVGAGVLRGFDVTGLTDLRFVPALGETGVITVEFFQN